MGGIGGWWWLHQIGQCAWRGVSLNAGSVYSRNLGCRLDLANEFSVIYPTDYALLHLFMSFGGVLLGLCGSSRANCLQGVDEEKRDP